jgi:hypothetical protein
MQHACFYNQFDPQFNWELMSTKRSLGLKKSCLDLSIVCLFYFVFENFISFDRIKNAIDFELRNRILLIST